MEATSVARTWVPQDALPHSSHWKGPLSDGNVELVRRGLTLHLACMSAHKTVPYKYSKVAQHEIDGTQIWQYCRNTTGDMVLIREVPASPVVVQLTVTNRQVLGYLLSGRLIFVHTIDETPVVRACDLKPLVEQAIVDNDIASRFRKVKMVNDQAHELKGRRVVYRTRAL